MLYIDSSALTKRYFHEKGSDALKARLERAAATPDPVLTSFLSYAEIHAVLARKLRERALAPGRYRSAALMFDDDWQNYLTRIEISHSVLTLVPHLVRRYPLKGSDAVQLASALWAEKQVGSDQLRGQAQLPIVFITSDRRLASAAELEQLQVVNPELT